MMMPPSLPCSLLMCSSAKYVPLITDACTQEDGQRSHGNKNWKYLLAERGCCVCVSHQVDLDGLLPVLLIVDAGVVDNDVQAAERVHRFLEGVWGKTASLMIRILVATAITNTS